MCVNPPVYQCVYLYMSGLRHGCVDVLVAPTLLADTHIIDVAIDGSTLNGIEKDRRTDRQIDDRMEVSGRAGFILGPCETWRWW